MKQIMKITITSRDNNTWQGTLLTQQGAFFFRSEIELLLEMARRLETDTAGSEGQASFEH